MSDITCCKKGLVYTFLSLNIFLSFIPEPEAHFVFELLIYLKTHKHLINCSRAFSYCFKLRCFIPLSLIDSYVYFFIGYDCL